MGKIYSLLPIPFVYCMIVDFIINIASFVSIIFCFLEGDHNASKVPFRLFDISVLYFKIAHVKIIAQ